ncbi:hypothetical protein A2291_06835 [candidate division WOR-1 bacterium RIFOXYB2_FULL_42_35]|uniref:Fis family transcriptional regulator n=1 Tax=candidate division WOR-1 bacterium RIFOXYC2_FULL_41_25 TaxID=1802586 RepID=A0A1F4TQ33_UNCSA|nr:MAG: hypothetical protein A2291_06835 [candidate division WOR-1 bacterium RIFOXYB2_FULL_42_35]OGC24594.1 MAG: hypothetical protein A2247_06615 [candidate division WOR-1 bacterium RIFOXYA2_FULL_41_14]OGC34640.1 MAG: hypothetical protein A2462_04850 [candidate division WOR-1 bacterium RIFOXYC2_FULL_41_25]OGC43309.1 MAG: hypothetical protein A2548_07595 [candidate division WOR-1 bacterium RIFOXYD2_FULL_41_8]
MTNQPATILALDDERSMLLTYQNILKKKYNIITTPSTPEALKLLSQQNVDVVLLDIRMPRINGIEAFKRIRTLKPEMEIVMVTASNEALDAVEALKLGAFDYILKPFELKQLVSTIEKALKKMTLIRENLYLKERLAQSSSYCDLLGNTQEMKRIFETIDIVAKTDSSILITGESGTGKELVAKAIHQKSRRASQPYVTINCAALPETLLESELFGFERGAFTGATERKPGKFELANLGTLFLDEIGCMTAKMQAKLLRSIQSRSVDRVGGTVPIPIDVRIISATNIDFQPAISDRSFREDLFYRLNVIPIHLPPLRERIRDLPLFLNYFLNKFNAELNRQIQGFNKEAIVLLESYDWPGNIRELQNIVERLVTLCFSQQITAEHVKKSLSLFGNKDNSMEVQALFMAVESFEKKHILKALERTSDNRTQAARLLGIARSTLISKISSLNIC